MTGKSFKTKGIHFLGKTAAQDVSTSDKNKQHQCSENGLGLKENFQCPSSLLTSLLCATSQGQNLREYFLNNGLNLTTASHSAKQKLHALSFHVLQDFY